VQLTNRHNQSSQRALIEAQADQHRTQLEFDLRSSLQQETLRTRSELYEALLAKCHTAAQLAAWGKGEAVADQRGPLTNEDLLPLWVDVKNLRFRALVHCSASVRHQVELFADAAQSVDETSPSETWDVLVAQAQALQQCIIEAAVADRSGGVPKDGLGGM
jgi:hypothetical protein